MQSEIQPVHRWNAVAEKPKESFRTLVLFHFSSLQSVSVSQTQTVLTHTFTLQFLATFWAHAWG